jgi:hypothetical protein
MENEAFHKSGSSFEIRLRNHIDSNWSAFFDGWTIINKKNGEVLLRNSNVDQAGLHGVLNKIRDLNLTLLSVNRTKEENE